LQKYKDQEKTSALSRGGKSVKSKQSLESSALGNPSSQMVGSQGGSQEDDIQDLG